MFSLVLSNITSCSSVIAVASPEPCIGSNAFHLYSQFSPPDLLSLDEFVFNSGAHPFLIPSRWASSLPPTLWTGPDQNALLSHFTSTVGFGTAIQQWSRVQQASILAQVRAPPIKKLGPQPGMRGYTGPPLKKKVILTPEQKKTTALANLGNFMDLMNPTQPFGAPVKMMGGFKG